MSRIVTPADSIRITIDGLTGKVDLKTSREMPGMYVVLILTQLAASLCEQGLREQVMASKVTATDFSEQSLKTNASDK